MSFEDRLNTACCVVGGGPAGMMTGFLLARAGIDVIVVEKHSDFFRDFRGDTVHPSTLELIHELGLLNEFLRLPHQEVRQLTGQIGDDLITVADFSHVRTICKFIALMPQWDFLAFLSSHAQRYSAFRLKMNTKAVGLIEENGRVGGVKCDTDQGPCEIHSQVVIGADGRGSLIREAAGLVTKDIGAPMDVLWFRLSRKEADPGHTVGRVGIGAILIMLNRKEYWQCGLVIPKGSFADLQERGLNTFREKIASIAAPVRDRVAEIATWSDVRLLTVKVDRLSQWYREGLLCIGDAAHAMSPIGGVGINLAIQDAVATANLLWKPLSENRCTAQDLARIQQRRDYPTRMTQALQIFLQRHLVSPTLASTSTPSAPMAAKLLNLIPGLRSIPANIIGIGFRPEHIQSPDSI